MKKPPVILILGIGVLLMAGISVIRKPANPGTQEPASARTSAIRAGEDDTLRGSHTKRDRKVDIISFQQRAMDLGTMKQTTERDDTLRDLARDWGSKDAVAAEQWAQTLTDDRMQALHLVCLTLAEHAPEDAIAMAERNLPDGAVVEEIVGRWARMDFPAASAWISESTSGDKRDQMLAKLALSRAEVAAEEAATIVSMAMNEGPAQEEAAMSVLHQWLRKDREAAESWIASFPDGPLKERGQREIEGMKEFAASLQPRSTAPPHE